MFSSFSLLVSAAPKEMSASTIGQALGTLFPGKSFTEPGRDTAEMSKEGHSPARGRTVCVRVPACERVHEGACMCVGVHVCA